MAEKIILGKNGQWGVKENGLLAYNDEDNVFKAIEMDFNRSSTATRESSAGLITESPLNTPRIDFSDDANGALLLEPQSTNLITYSEDFSNGSWLKSIAVVTLTSEIAPDGTNDSVYNFVGAGANLYTDTQSAGLDYTISFYIKSNGNGKDVFKLRLGSDFSQVFTATNEWVRYTFSATPSTQVFGISSNGIDSDILIWGAQLEQKSYATSYIPTSGATATRIAETCSKTGLENYINSSEGVLYVETKGFTDLQPVSTYIQLSKSGETGFNNSLTLQHRDNGTLRVYVNGTATANITFIEDIDFSQNHKIAVLYKLNGYKLFIDGVEKNLYLTPSQTVFSGLDSLSFDSRSSGKWNGKIKDLRVYDTALTDAELTTLTTL